VKAINTIKFKV